jgi:hypothetical protein
VKKFFETLTTFFKFRREYILFPAGILCFFFLLTAAALVQSNEQSRSICQFKIGTEIPAEVPQTFPANSVLRGTPRFQRSVSQLRNSYFFNAAVPAERTFCFETITTFSTFVYNVNYFRLFYAKKNPVRAGPAVV